MDLASEVLIHGKALVHCLTLACLLNGLHLLPQSPRGTLRLDSGVHLLQLLEKILLVGRLGIELHELCLPLLLLLLQKLVPVGSESLPALLNGFLSIDLGVLKDLIGGLSLLSEDLTEGFSLEVVGRFELVEGQLRKLFVHGVETSPDRFVLVT